MQVRLSIVLVGLLIFSINPTPQSKSQCCTISGYVLDDNSQPLIRIPITIKRGGEVLRGDNKTDENGYYSINYREGRGTLEAVIYGNTKWGPSLVQNLSGNKSHILNKVLVNAEQSKFSIDQASDVLAVLDYLRINENLYSKEIVQFAGVFKKASFPEELRLRLTEFEQVAAAIKERVTNKEAPTKELALARNNPLVDDRPVMIVRKQSMNRKTRRTRSRRAVEIAYLLKLQWRLFKVKENGTLEESSPLTVFHPGDRLRLAVKTYQDGYLYIIHQSGPSLPGQIIFPDSRVNGGKNDVRKSQEVVLPSSCPTEIQPLDCAFVVNPPSGQEVFTLVFSRDPFTDLPNAASEVTGDIPVEKLRTLKASSGQTLRRVRGSTPLAVLVVNTNTKDNEDIFETLVLNKTQ